MRTVRIGPRSRCGPDSAGTLQDRIRLSRSLIPGYRGSVADSVELVKDVPENNVAEPIPERLRETVWKAEDTGDPAVLAALSPEDHDTAVRYLRGIQANIAQVLGTPSASRP